MSVLSVERALELIRVRVLEKDPDFWDQREALRAFDEGARRLLNLIIGGAHLSRRLRRHGHPFLKRYIAREPYSLLVGQLDLPLPEALWYEIQFNMQGSPPMQAKWKEPDEDRYVRTYPDEFGPVAGEVFWTIIPTDDATSMLRVYVAGVGATSNAVYPAELLYFRRYQPCFDQSPPVDETDIDEEFSEGIIAYAAGKLLAKQRSDPQPLYNELLEFAKRIGLPPIDPQAAAILPKKVP